MCLLRRKLIVFDYVIGKLVDWDRNVNGRTEQESLKLLSNIRLMKGLYSICVGSIRPALDMGGGTIDLTNQLEQTVTVVPLQPMQIPQTGRLGNTLFDLYNNFRAYPRGPVEADAYGNLSSLIRYTLYDDVEARDSYLIPNDDYKTEFGINYPTLDRTLLKVDKQQAIEDIIQKEGVEWARDKVDEAVALLMNASEFPSLNDKDRLIQLTHLGLWEDAYHNKSDKKLDTNDALKLKQEWIDFSKRIGLN